MYFEDNQHIAPVSINSPAEITPTGDSIRGDIVDQSGFIDLYPNYYEPVLSDDYEIVEDKNGQLVWRFKQKNIFNMEFNF